MSDDTVRRRQLIEATIETLAEVGFHAASLSEIARRAKVSTGLFAHYFGDKDGLLEATLRFMAARLARSTAARLSAAATRLERVFAVCEAALADEEFDRRTGAVWLAFWGQMAHSDRFRRVQRVYELRMISNLRHALHGLVPEDRVDPSAVLIAAGIDGLWLRSHAAAPGDGAIFSDGRSARALIRVLIEGLLACPAPEASAAPLSKASSAPSLQRGGLAVPAGPWNGKAQGPPDWEALGAADRARVLRRCADALRTGQGALARLEALETGRPIRATAADLSEAIADFEDAAGAALDMRRVRIELAGGRVEERRSARGRVVAAAIPWSRPVLEIGACARAPARGDALRFSVDPHAARTVAEVVGLLANAGLPDGVLAPAPREAGRRTNADSSFDDTAPFGRAGPKAATVNLPGADLDAVARSVCLGSRAWTGSTFASQSLVCVHASIRRRFAEACAAAAAGLVTGDPLAQETEVGPLLSPEHGQWILDLLAAEVGAGASLVAGGRTLSASPAEPVFLAPTIVEGCGPRSALARAHTFAPVVALQSFDDDEQVAFALLREDDAAQAIGVFAGDWERAARLVAACDRPLSFVNDDGLGESLHAWRRTLAADAPPVRRTIMVRPPGGF